VSDKPPGTVLSQNPAKGKKVDNGTTIVLTVAKARPTVAVPKLTGLTVAQAQTALQTVNLQLSQPTTAFSDTVPAGKIISSNPAVGTQVAKGTFVDVVVSQGQQMVTVPDLVSGCLSVTAAENQLSQLGLVGAVGAPTTKNPLCVNADRIAAQEPPAGSSVPLGTTVMISQGTEGSPSPSP